MEAFFDEIVNARVPKLSSVRAAVPRPAIEELRRLEFAESTRLSLTCPCHYCRRNYWPTRTPSETEDSNDRKWFEGELEEAVANTLAFQRRHADSVYLKPQGWLDWYSQLFSAIIGISVLGAGFTFSVIFNDFKAPDDRPKWKKAEHVRTCLAASWMLFVISIGVTSFIALVVGVNKKFMLQALEKTCYLDGRWYKDGLLFVMTVSTLIVQILPIAAFSASAKAVTAYHTGIGNAIQIVLYVIAGILFVFWVASNRFVHILHH